MNRYGKFAEFYNELMDCDYDKWSQFLTNHGCKGEGIDLACGTGNITLRLSQYGCRMTGVDISEQMLTVAESKKTTVGNPIFVCGNMVGFPVLKKPDFVTCVCDGINYLNPCETVVLFNRVYENLKRGGVFIFDISSEYKLTKILADNVFAEDLDDLTYVWFNSLQKDKLYMDLIFFERQGEIYARFDETHIQYAHKTSELIERLNGAGFSEIDTFDCYSEKQIKSDTERVVFRAKKG